jgi:hypothetical protein
MSFCRADLVEQPSVVLEGWDGYFLVSLSVGFLRGLGFAVTHDPPRNDDPGHTWVKGPASKKIRSTLARESVWVVAPPDVDLPI